MADLSEEQLSKVKYEEEFIPNSRGFRLFTCRWQPATREPKALICLCHDTGVRLAKSGYAVFGIDYEGHGKSDGMRCYIQSFEELVNDCADFFKSIGDRDEYRNKARFLYGESMGGPVALLIHRKQPKYWNGAVLVAPMCKDSHIALCSLQSYSLPEKTVACQSYGISAQFSGPLISGCFLPVIQIADDLKPHPVVISILNRLTGIIPTWKIVPTQDILNVGFKDLQKREEIRTNPYIYRGRPRLKTGYELLMASMDIEKRLDEVTLPFLILHGEADAVTDPAVSKLLYESARSTDKSIKLYPDMWHGLTCGEPAANTQLVFADITAWLDKRSAEHSNNLEQNGKEYHEFSSPS